VVLFFGANHGVPAMTWTFWKIPMLNARFTVERRKDNPLSAPDRNICNGFSLA
jgi:hypothetical protein